MEFSNRGTQHHNSAGSPAPSAAAPARHSGKIKGSKLFRISTVALLFSVTILVIALVISLFFGNLKPESKYLNKSNLQAVFLNNGQVYFGNIRSLNDKYVRLGNIYYLRVNQQVQPNQSTSNQSQDISLVKLGCELHGPTDEMLINRDQVTFWENLKSDGQVAKAVAQYIQQNPNGQKCDTTSAAPASSNSTTTPSPSTSTTKKQ